jgi:antitoxin (DNA-binding transcriptional repressor) of toxin-antitoxin stability system
MTTVNIHDAKTHLSRLLARVEAGETVVAEVTEVAEVHAAAAEASRGKKGGGKKGGKKK